jgi:polyhydroxyalkanoate synthesis regulator phasin
MSDFEILMVSIDWERPNNHISITRSAKPLELIKRKDKSGRDNSYECDVVIYTKEDGKYFQFCVKTPYTPYVVIEDNDEKSYAKLHNIESDLWIIKSEWRIGQRSKGYHYCPSINTLGKLNLIITKEGKKSDFLIAIDINNKIDDFDFDQLKSDFEGELWGLLTTDKSRVNTKRAEVGNFIKKISFAENKLLDNFLFLYDKVTSNPKVELLSAMAEERIGKVKPLTETYKTIARKGYANGLPSKSVAENIDIYENRFICLMLYRIHLIVKNNIANLEKQVFKQAADIDLKRQIITILEQPFIEVNGELLKFEIDQSRSAFESWRQNWESCRNDFLKRFTTTQDDYRYAKILVKSIQKIGLKTNVWVNCWWRKEIDKHHDGQFCVFEFQGDVSDVLEEDKDLALEIAVSYTEGKYKSKKGKEWVKYVIKGVKPGSLNYGISRLEKIIKIQEEKYLQLKEKNWRKLLETQEIAERNSQIKTLSKDIQRLEKQCEDLADFLKEQINLLPLLEQRMRCNFFSTVNWRQLKKIAPSMTFIQNAVYRSALENYNQILKSEGISLEVFDLYERTTNYGVREMPLVYELWCLVSIIKVLNETYHLKHDLKEINMLLKIIDPKNKSRSNENALIFNFKGNLRTRNVRLLYQKTLPNNNRPDFILEIKNNSRVVSLILDSKFKNYNYKKSLNYEVQELCSKYNGINNYVFALHPCNDLKRQDVNVRMTNHGGERLYFEKDDNKSTQLPSHKFGYITLKPGLTGNLKKLIGLGIEYLIEPNKNAYRKGIKDPKPSNDLICINCGGEDIELITKSRNDNLHYISKCKSQDCGHQVHIDYCWACFTVLYKHGYTWDYHRTSIWSPYDIHCPCCGVTVAEMPSIREGAEY